MSAISSIKGRRHHVQVRRWGPLFYVSFHCSARGCEEVWKSSYFQTRAEAEKYATGVQGKPRCLSHRKDAWSRWLSGRGGRPTRGVLRLQEVAA